MMTLRTSGERGYADHGWLKSFHSFSFAGYHDPDHMGFGNLRVINEDRVAAGRGFGTHSHQNMEIISYVLSGELAHKDSMGNVKGIPPGDVQRMSAGTGVQHSEFNHAANQTTHFLQIWIEPNVMGVAPGYEQKTFSEIDKRGALRLVASPDGAQDSVSMHADARLYAGLFDGPEGTTMVLDPKRKAMCNWCAVSLRSTASFFTPATRWHCSQKMSCALQTANWLKFWCLIWLLDKKIVSIQYFYVHF